MYHVRIIKYNYVYSKTLDELREEMLDRRNEIARESVISTLIGLEQGVDVVKLDVQMEYDFIGLSLEIRTDEYNETFEKNREAIIEMEEYELLNEIQKYLG